MAMTADDLHWVHLRARSGVAVLTITLGGSPVITPVSQSPKRRAASMGGEAIAPEKEASPHTWVLEMSVMGMLSQLLELEQNSTAWGQDLWTRNRPQPMLVLDARGSHQNELVEEKWTRKQFSPDSVLIPGSMTSQWPSYRCFKKVFWRSFKKGKHGKWLWCRAMGQV